MDDWNQFKDAKPDEWDKFRDSSDPIDFKSIGLPTNDLYALGFPVEKPDYKDPFSALLSQPMAQTVLGNMGKLQARDAEQYRLAQQATYGSPGTPSTYIPSEGGGPPKSSIDWTQTKMIPEPVGKQASMRARTSADTPVTAIMRARRPHEDFDPTISSGKPPREPSRMPTPEESYQKYLDVIRQLQKDRKPHLQLTPEQPDWSKVSLPQMPGLYPAGVDDDISRAQYANSLEGGASGALKNLAVGFFDPKWAWLNVGTGGVVHFLRDAALVGKAATVAKAGLATVGTAFSAQAGKDAYQLYQNGDTGGAMVMAAASMLGTLGVMHELLPTKAPLPHDSLIEATKPAEPAPAEPPVEASPRVQAAAGRARHPETGRFIAKPQEPLQKMGAMDRFLAMDMKADLTGLPNKDLDTAIVTLQAKIDGYKAKQANTTRLDETLQRLQAEKQSRLQGGETGAIQEPQGISKFDDESIKGARAEIENIISGDKPLGMYGMEGPGLVQDSSNPKSLSIIKRGQQHFVFRASNRVDALKRIKQIEDARSNPDEDWTTISRALGYSESQIKDYQEFLDRRSKLTLQQHAENLVSREIDSLQRGNAIGVMDKDYANAVVESLKRKGFVPTIKKVGNSYEISGTRKGQVNASEIQSPVAVGKQPIGTEGVRQGGTGGVEQGVQGAEAPQQGQAQEEVVPPKLEEIQSEHDAALGRLKARRQVQEAPAPEPPTPVKAAPKPRVVDITVGDTTKRVVLNKDQAKQWDAAEQNYKEHLAMIDRQEKVTGPLGRTTRGSGTMTTEAAQARKAAGMEWAAQKREITGHYTDKEASAINARLATNYDGKPVMVDGEPGTVTGRAFGKIRVKMEDGQVRAILPENISEHPNAPGIKPRAPEYKTATEKLQSAEDAATQRLKDRKRGLQSGIDPEDLKDLTIIGMAKIAKLGVKTAQVSAKWAKEMIQDVGDWIKPHIQELWDAAKAEHDKRFAQEKPSFTLEEQRHLLKWGSALHAEGYTDGPSGKWGKEMVKDQGERIKPFLKTIWDRMPENKTPSTTSEVKPEKTQAKDVPPVMFHGSPTPGLTEIKPQSRAVAKGDYGEGIQLTTRRDQADHYSRGRKAVAANILGDTDSEPPLGTVYQVEHNMKNPLVITDQAQYDRLETEGQSGLSESQRDRIWGDRAIARYAKANGYDGVVNHLSEEHVVFTDKPLPVKPTEPAKAEPPKEPPAPPKETRAKPEGVTGVAKVITQRPPQEGVTIPQELEEGRNLIETRGETHILNRADEVIKTGEPMNDKELSAVGYHLRTLQNRRDEVFGAIEKASDPALLSDLSNTLESHDAQTEKLLQAADITLNHGFHRLGMAAQIALHKDYSLQSLPQRAKAALKGFDDFAPKDMDTKIKGFQDTNSEIRNKLKEDVAAIPEDIQKANPVPKTDWKHRFWQAAIKKIRQYAGEEPGEPDVEVSGGNQKGAVKYTFPKAQMDQMKAFRQVAKKIAVENPDYNFDQVIKELRNRANLPESFTNEQVYYALSESYRKHMLESDINRIQADRYLRNIKRSAEYHLKPLISKAWAHAQDVLNMTQRTLQAGADVSFPFIQGRKGLIVNPRGWLQMWGPTVKAAIKGNEIADKSLEVIERSPQWPAAKAAGLQMRRISDRFSPEQDELFAGSLVHILANIDLKPEGQNKSLQTFLLPFKAAAKTYGKVYEHSEALFVTAANELTWDTYLKLASADPKNPAYLRDVASTINTIYGRGASKFARDLGSHPEAGMVLYAPRYYISTLEYASGRPVLKAETARGRVTALRVYATQAAVYGTLIGLARMNGWNVDTDPRSSDFGKVEVPMPNGKKYKADLFAKEAQAYRFVAQMLYGKISQTGNYTEPSNENMYKTAGAYLTGKLAPAASMGVQVWFGKLDKKNNQFINRPLTTQDIFLDYTPLWIQQAYQDNLFNEAPYLTIPQIAGESIDKGKLSKTKVKLKWNKTAIQLHGR